jgi:hypothetical protein
MNKRKKSGKKVSGSKRFLQAFKRNRSAVILTVLALVLVVAAGACYMNHRPKSLDALLPVVSKAYKADFSNTTLDNNIWEAQEAINVPESVSGSNFSLAPSSVPTLYFLYGPDMNSKTVRHLFFFKRTIKPAANNGDVQREVDKILRKNGFAYRQSQTHTARYIDNVTELNTQTVTTRVYTRGNNTCQYSQTSTSVLGLPELSCYDSSSWSAAAARAKPFVDAYVQAHPGAKESDISFGPLTIKSRHNSGVIMASETPGYDIAEALLLDKGNMHLTLFYKHGGVWHYAASANDEYGFPCSAMAANAASRQAFHDQICLSSNGQVRLDTNRRALQ